MPFVRVAKWFVVVWSAFCVLGLMLGVLRWYHDTGSSISDSEWSQFENAITWWLQFWFFPTFGMIAVEFLFRDNTPMINGKWSLARFLPWRQQARHTP